MKKILAISIILLFIGVAIAPSINQSVVKASDDNDLIEVTTQACGIQGYRNTTVKLTMEQYQNLEQYLVEFRARLNQTSTREEAVPIFKDAVVELDKYGLLPSGMSVEKVMRLVVHDSMKNTHKLQSINENTNFLSLVVGQLSPALFIPSAIFPLALVAVLIAVSGGLFGLILYFLFHNDNFLLWGFIPAMIMEHIFGNIVRYMQFIPITLFSYSGPLWCPSTQVTGWLYSLGTLGLKSWNGTFATVTLFGFTGLKLRIEDGYEETFFMGTSFLINILPDHHDLS
jgi:hypothetical protein